MLINIRISQTYKEYRNNIRLKEMLKWENALTVQGEKEDKLWADEKGKLDD